MPGTWARPAEAVAQGDAEDLGAMSISLSDVVKTQLGVQGQTQAAGTPNQIGVGGFFPLHVDENSVFFLDVLANLNFADFWNDSSIINTTVAGTTISTSTRLGYRWLNGDRSWMFGIHGGYDTRPMATGYADNGRFVSDEKTVFFQQAAFGFEAVSNEWNFNAYGLIPTGQTEYELNNNYWGGALQTYGLNVAYNLTPSLTASVGYYYQNGDLGAADGSGAFGQLAYRLSNDLTLNAKLTHDDAFDTRISGGLEWRFNANSARHGENQKKAWEAPVIKALSESVKNRDVRVHDKSQPEYCYDVIPPVYGPNGTVLEAGVEECVPY